MKKKHGFIKLTIKTLMQDGSSSFVEKRVQLLGITIGKGTFVILAHLRCNPKTQCVKNE